MSVMQQHSTEQHQMAKAWTSPFRLRNVLVEGLETLLLEDLMKEQKEENSLKNNNSHATIQINYNNFSFDKNPTEINAIKWILQTEIDRLNDLQGMPIKPANIKIKVALKQEAQQQQQQQQQNVEPEPWQKVPVKTFKGSSFSTEFENSSKSPGTVTAKIEYGQQTFNPYSTQIQALKDFLLHEVRFLQNIRMKEIRPKDVYFRVEIKTGHSDQEKEERRQLQDLTAQLERVIQK